MDLSKAFDSLNHELLLAKLHANGISRSALMLIHSYLLNRRQRVKINGPYTVRARGRVLVVFGVGGIEIQSYVANCIVFSRCFLSQIIELARR